MVKDLLEIMAPRKRRLGTTADTITSTEEEEDTEEGLKSRRSLQRKEEVLYLPLMSLCGGLFCLALFLFNSLSGKKSLALKWLSFVPSLICVYLGTSCKGKDRILPFVLAVSSLGSYLPLWMAAAFASAALLAFSISTQVKTVKLTEAPPVSRILVGVFVMVTTLLVENMLIWVVSATFVPGFRADTQPPALQDNGQIIIKAAMRGLTKRQVVGLRRSLNVQWSLVSCFCSSLWIIERHPSRHLHAVATRAVYTLALARFIRTVSFVITVLPSQISGCFLQRFVMPPDDWWSWIKVGFLPASSGGCNDLIISGHATVTSTLACVSVSLHSTRLFGVTLMLLLWVDYCLEIYEGFHYSVDMWLGFVLVNLIWRSLSFFEELPKQQSPVESRDESVPSEAFIAYVIPSMISYLQVSWFPKSWVNGWIVVFMVVGTAAFVIDGKDEHSVLHGHHLAQHILLCTLFIALGVYL